jgi:iron complex transport system substrate-binding protein
VLRIPGINQTPAGRNRRIIVFEAMYLLSFGPRMPTAVAALQNEITKAMQT